MHVTPTAAVVLLLTVSASASAQVTPWCFTGFHPGEVSGTVFLPEGDLFCPLISDPKAERSFMSLQRGRFPSLQSDGDVNGDLDIGAVGLADALPLVRFGSGAGNGIQLALVAGVFAQFDLDTDSFDLINADYLVGLPVTLRWSGFSSRLRLYHQSSHLGDEFLLRSDVLRENLSFESLELLLSQELGPARAYAGGEYLFNRDPATVDRTIAHGGLELRAGRLRGVRFVAAGDVKLSEQRDWEPGISVRAGVEVAHWRDEAHPPRLWALLLELYDGPSPYGQFFQENVRWLGVGLHLTL